MTSPIRSLHTDVGDRPFIVIWEVTRACALACAHCRADAIPRRDPRELTTEQGFALLDDLAAYGPPRPMVVLTGGDPFERDDLAQLVAHGTAAGLHISLSPSVTPRLTAETLVEMREAGAHVVSLSLDGASAATHDAFRGIDGTFDSTLAAAATVRDAGLRLQLNTTGHGRQRLGAARRAGPGHRPRAQPVERVLPGAHRPRCGPARAAGPGSGAGPVVAARDRRRGAGEDHRGPALPPDRHPAGGGPGGRGRPAGPLLDDLRRRTRPHLPRRAGSAGRSRPPLDVNAGRGFAFIDHTGSVQPSGFLPVSVGSVSHQTFSTIYREAPLLRALRDPDALGGRCGRCEFRTVCGGSRSHAFAVWGDPLAEDPGCSYQPAGEPASGPDPSPLVIRHAR